MSNLALVIASSSRNSRKLLPDFTQYYSNFIFLFIPGSGAEAQHHSADVWGEGGGGGGTASGPGGCEEYVQNPD